MKQLVIFITLIFSQNLFSQELIKGISYDMPKKEAKKVISNNPDAFTITIGSAKFTEPYIHASEGLTKLLDFSEPISLVSSRSKSSAIDKTNSIRDFFIGKGFMVLRESEPSEGNSALGASATNILLMIRDNVYTGVVCTSVASGTAFNSQYTYSIVLRITSASLDDEMFKKYMFYPKPSSKNKADSLF